MTNLFRWLPAIEAILENEKIAEINACDHKQKTQVARETVDFWRQQIKENPEKIAELYKNEDQLQKAIIESIAEKLSQHKVDNHLQKVVNGTGIALHTNLGRAPLAKKAISAVNDVISAYCNLELDLATGERAQNRYANVQDLICEITGAEDCMVVNNNAAAILLALNTFGAGKQGVISRGQLVEIGGSFRVPEIMEKSGVKLYEIGTTNKTRISDYESAILNIRQNQEDTENSGILLVVHPSNFHMTGFVETPDLGEIAQLGEKYGFTTIYDWGCGALYPLADLGVGKESTIQNLLRSQVDVITMSGDKLMGGPQCGIILGTKEKVQAMYQNPLTRALRPDKMILAALEGTLQYYKNPDEALKNIPILRELTEDEVTLAKRAGELAEKLQAMHPNHQISVCKTQSPVGGGSLPDVSLTTYAVQIRNVGNLNNFSQTMRLAETPVIGYIQNDAFNIDVRTLQPQDDVAIIKAYQSFLNNK